MNRKAWEMYFSLVVRGLKTSSIQLQVGLGYGSAEGPPFCRREVPRKWHLPLASLVSDVVLHGPTDLAFVHKGTVNHAVEETTFKLHL